MNKLLYGDCLTHLREMAKWSVDLIYLDPPFNSNREYNSIYKDETGRLLPDQIEAFNDTWTLDAERERAIRSMPVLMREAGIDDDVTSFWKLWMNALRGTNPRLLAYLSYMTERLLQMKSVLKPTGSIYLHCDPTASHYIKVLMDAIFRHSNFRSEIIWKRTSAHSSARRPGPVHDCLLFYTMGDDYTWNPEHQDYDEDYIAKRFRKDEAGRWFKDSDATGSGIRNGYTGKSWRGLNPTDKGRHWAYPPETMDQLDEAGHIYWPKKVGAWPRLKQYLDELHGVSLQDVWTDIFPINSQAKERLGYRTQKPLSLMERIIGISSNPGDVVLDPFCGCATTLEAAHNLERQWIGVDIAIHAIKRVARIRLEERLGLAEGKDFVIDGVPCNMEGAQDLWGRDKYDFQRWAVEQVDGFVTSKRTADGGIDGRLYFGIYGQRDLSSMAIEVKGGKHVNITHLRALRGVLESDVAEMAGLITMHPLGDVQRRNFERFAAEAGTLDVLGTSYDRIQLLTVPEILEGKKFHTPSVAGLGITGQGQLPLSEQRNP